MAILDEIAKRVGVSKMTVARVLQGGNKEIWPSIAARSEKIRRIAAEMNWKPNAAARATATGTFNSIALMLSIHPHRSTLPELTLKSIQAELDVHRMYLAVTLCDDRRLTDTQYVPSVLNQLMADGMLLNYSQTIPPRLIELVQGSGRAAIWMNSKHQADCVYPDDRMGGYLATQHLIDKGHTRIIYLDFTASDHYSTQERLAGYVRAMRDAGLTPLSIVEPVTIHDAAIRRHRFLQVIKTTPRPTAIVDNGSPMGTYVAAMHAGMQVPQDLSIIGIGGLDSGGAGVDFTGYMPPESELGREAVRALIGKIRTPSRKRKPVVVPLKFHQGATVAPVRS